MEVKKIIFVCHGNICRSPMAEFIFKSMANNLGVSDKFSVCSRATSDEEIWNGIGQPIYPKAKEQLLHHGIAIGDKKAVQLKRNDYYEADMFIGMDSANIRNMKILFGGDADYKIHKLLEFTGSKSDVADPWYSGDFDKAYNDIEMGCNALLNFLLFENS